LSLYTNNLTGELAADGFAARSLIVIDVSMNQITGFIPEVFGGLENLTVLSLYSNRLNGTLPPELGKHSPGLYHVGADDNELTGAIPEGLCAGGKLHTLTANRNHLNGSIPAGLANCTTLYSLQLGSNNLSGTLEYY
jgi:Leucine-rich repeat (LRR) protein